MRIRKSLFLIAVMALVSSVAFAQSYYDDDIYFDASKAPKKDKKKENVKNQYTYQASDFRSQYVTASDGTVYYIDEKGNAYPTTAVALPGSDEYTVDSNNTRDVDEYNRRYSVGGGAVSDSVQRDAFANTRMIEKFSNPRIVTDSDDADLIEYYNNTQPVNIYIGTPTYYGWASPYYSSVYWNSWWDPWYYGPSYAWGWGPSWAWNWGPSWSWGWGPSWSWGWGPSWSWGWGHSWGPSWGWHRPIPQSSPGAYRPHRPYATSGQGGYRGNQSGRPITRPSAHNSGGYRGSATINSGVNGVPQQGRPSNGGSIGGQRPTSGNIGGVRPSGNVRPSSGQNRYNSGSVNGGGRGTRRDNNYNINNNNNRNNNNYNNNRSNNGSFRQSTPSRSSSGGYNGGGMRGGSSGGGGRGGGRR